MRFFDAQISLRCTGCGHKLLMRWTTTEQDTDGRELRVMRSPCTGCDLTRECRLRVPIPNEFNFQASAGGAVSATGRVSQISPALLGFAPAAPTETGAGQIWWEPPDPK